ncbi:protein O-mannosyl-transferase TMTC4 isoform X2 [Petromyzon marinus]|uniref:protein O-mannosyl-transferase TMTC4 isoform X2 n=1 Tax=Petromyzon marinus TaxID=7757 RepID=UPI003F6F1C6D
MSRRCDGDATTRAATQTRGGARTAKASQAMAQDGGEGALGASSLDLDDAALPVPSMPPALARALAALTAALSFIVSYDGAFVFDDSEAVVGNKDLKPETPLSSLWIDDFWGGRLSSNTSHKSYRPLTVLTFRFNYWASGGLNPTGFHLVNIALHSVVSALLYDVCCLLVGWRGSRGSPACRTALLASVMFAVHPVHAESVAGVVGRADLLCALFFFLSFISYAAAFTGSEHGAASVSATWIVLSVTLSAVATLCKEQGVTVIALCSAYDAIAVSGIDPLGLAKSALHLGGVGMRSKVPTVQGRRGCTLAFACRQAALATALLATLAARWWVMGGGAPAFTPDDNPAAFADGLLTRVVNYNYLYALNAWLLLDPQWLCFDWSMGCVPLISAASDWRIVAPLCLWLALGALSLRALRARDESERRRLLLALVLLLVPFAPAANVLVRVGFVLAERVLYTSAAGHALLVTHGLSRLARRCPRHKVHYNIGKNSADNGDERTAIAYYGRALSLHPAYVQPMNNLGNILKGAGKLHEAEQLLRRAVQIQPDFAAAWMNLGIVQNSRGDFLTAEQSFLTALRHRKQYPDCYYNLGRLYLDVQRPADALEAWRTATLQQPLHRLAWNNMVVLLDNSGSMEEAARIGRLALQSVPGDHGLLFTVANVLGKMGRFQDSEGLYLQALKGNPNAANYHGNLGVLYHRWGRLEEARRSYETSLRMEPGDPGVRDNYGLLLRRLARDTAATVSPPRAD